MKEIDQLVRMANQIAANFSFHTDRVDRVADHLRRFWAPAMRKLLAERAGAANSGLDEVALQAVQRLQEGQK
jgi:formate dehydrogenase subunit delta